MLPSVKLSAIHGSKRVSGKAPLSLRVLSEKIEGQTPARYDLHSVHAAAFGGTGPYLYDKKASALAIRAYAQSEPRSKPIA